jgi:ABC-type polar amino acid transport system ATPase subunit
MITIRNLEKWFGNRPTLAGVSAHIREGERVAIVGPSGGGKTTLLRCLNGLEPFDGGTISIAGFDLGPGRTGLTAPELVRLRTTVGMVFQEHHLFPHLTALENLTLAPRVVRKQSPREVARRAHELLEQVGLADRKGAYPDALSGGQKQRVAIARALAQEPRVLLLDEPTSALDSGTAEGVAKTIAEVTRDSVTVVLVTHQLALAEAMATRTLRLEGGILTETT